MVHVACFVFVLFVVALLPIAIGFILPTVDDAHHFIEYGNASHPVKAVFTCENTFKEYPLSGYIEVFQDYPEECEPLIKKLSCIHEMPLHDKWFELECTTLNTVSLERIYQRTGFDGTVGFPTRIWETRSWLGLKQFDYIVAISSQETNDICGEDKIKFHDWMVAHKFGYLVPKRFMTPDEATYPCVVKQSLVPGSDFNFVSIAKNREELDLILNDEKAQTGRESLVTEMTKSKAEVVIYFNTYRSQLLNRLTCRVSFIDDYKLLLQPGFHGKKFRVKCKNIPGFTDEIRPFLASLTHKLKLNGPVFINIKLMGVESEDMFYGNEDKNLEWKQKLGFLPPFKVMELHPYVGAGLLADPRTLSKMIRQYYLAYYAALYDKKNYDYALFATHFRKHKEGEVPEFVPVE